jgi:hypothetical protein
MRVEAKTVAQDPVCILDSDISDTDDIVAIQRFATNTTNAYAVNSCVAGGDQVIQGLLNSLGSTLPVGYTTKNGNQTTEYWSVYDGLGTKSTTTALSVYKEALRKGKVDIITIGYLSNIYDLLQDEEGVELCKKNLNSIYITGGSVRGLGDCNFDFTPTIMNESIFVITKLEDLGIRTIYMTNDLANTINTPPFDELSTSAFNLLGRTTTPSWDIFSVYVYNNRTSKKLARQIEYIPTKFVINPNKTEVFNDVATNRSTFRVIKKVKDSSFDI